MKRLHNRTSMLQSKKAESFNKRTTIHGNYRSSFEQKSTKMLPKKARFYHDTGQYANSTSSFQTI